MPVGASFLERISDDASTAQPHRHHYFVGAQSQRWQQRSGSERRLHLEMHELHELCRTSNPRPQENAGGRGFESHEGQKFVFNILLYSNVKNCFDKLIKILTINRKIISSEMTLYYT